MSRLINYTWGKELVVDVSFLARYFVQYTVLHASLSISLQNLQHVKLHLPSV